MQALESTSPLIVYIDIKARTPLSPSSRYWRWKRACKPSLTAPPHPQYPQLSGLGQKEQRQSGAI